MLYNMSVMKTEKTVRIDARLKKSEKEKLLKLARSKGSSGITGLLRLLAKAKQVKIEI